MHFGAFWFSFFFLQPLGEAMAVFNRPEDMVAAWYSVKLLSFEGISQGYPGMRSFVFHPGCGLLPPRVR